MKAIEFQFHPQQIRISSEEILADLRYPARADRHGGPRSRRPRRRGRR